MRLLISLYHVGREAARKSRRGKRNVWSDFEWLGAKKNGRSKNSGWTSKRGYKPFYPAVPREAGRLGNPGEKVVSGQESVARTTLPDERSGH